MTRKALATIGFGAMSPVLDRTLPTFVEFSQRHGYELIACRTNEYADGRPSSWGKVRLLRHLLDEYDVVLWVDADAIILDGSEDPADLLADDDYQALVCLDQLGQSFPTCGVWLLRSTMRAKEFLDAIWRKDEYTNDRYWEQAAALDLLGYSIRPANLIEATSWTAGTLLLDESWNCMPLVTRTLSPCRIRHYAGEANSVRRRQMTRDRHQLAADASWGWRRGWHRMATIVGLLLWRLWDGPTGTFGSAHRVTYVVLNKAYGVAQALGLVTLVRRIRRHRVLQIARHGAE